MSGTKSGSCCKLSTPLDVAGLAKLDISSLKEEQRMGQKAFLYLSVSLQMIWRVFEFDEQKVRSITLQVLLLRGLPFGSFLDEYVKDGTEKCETFHLGKCLTAGLEAAVSRASI